MSDPVTASIILATAVGGSTYMQTRAQKKAAEKAEASARAQQQFQAEAKPEQQTEIKAPIEQKDESIKGLQSQILANKNKIAPIDGEKTLTGQ